MANSIAGQDEPDPPVSPPTIEEVSADLAFELQSKLFEQITTLGVAGAGLVITLKGSILSGASPIIWLGAIEFGFAALLSLAAQVNLIEGLFQRRLNRRSLRGMALAAILLMGMGIGTLGTSVIIEGKEPARSTSP